MKERSSKTLIGGGGPICSRSKLISKSISNQSLKKINKNARLIRFLCSRPCFLVGCGCSCWVIGICSTPTIKRSNFMQTGVSHAGPVTTDMKRSSNKRKVCFSYSSVYCSFHRWLCHFRANNICQDHRLQIVQAYYELHCTCIYIGFCCGSKRPINEKNWHICGAPL